MQAKKELLGNTSQNNPSDDADIIPRGMGSPPVSSGKRTPRRLPNDDQITSETVLEGIDEAEHEEIIQAGKTKTQSED